MERLDVLLQVEMQFSNDDTILLMSPPEDILLIISPESINIFCTIYPILTSSSVSVIGNMSSDFHENSGVFSAILFSIIKSFPPSIMLLFPFRILER